MRFKARIWTVAAMLGALGLLGGCATGPAVRGTSDPAADFAKYQTYGFVEHVGTDRGDYSTLVSRALKAAVSAEMEKRGYRLSETPDLLVNFQANTKHSQELSTAPATLPFYPGYFYGFEGPFYGYGCMESARDVNEGTLNIDVVDRVRRQSVWEGVALGHLTDEQMKEPEKALPPLVEHIFSKYPYAAGRGSAQAPH